MKKLCIITVLLILVTGLLLSACSKSTPSSAPSTSSPVTAAPSTPADTSPIKLGYISSLSGLFGSVDQYLTPAVQMAVDDINKNGGINGRQVELMARDDQGDPSLVAQKASELKAAGCVAIVGCLLDSCDQVLSQWSKDNQFPVSITCAATLSLRTTNFHKYAFNTNPVSLAMARIFVQNISKQQDVTKIYYIGSDENVAHDIYDLFWREIVKTRPEMTNLGASWVGVMDMEFSNIISAALAKEPDLILGGIAGPPWTSLVQQGQRFDLFNKTKWSGYNLIGAELTSSFGKDYPTGIQSTTWSPFFLDYKPMQDFSQAYLAKNKVYPADITMCYYVSAYTVLQAIKQANSTEPDAIVKAMETMSFDIPTGTVRYNTYDHQLNMPVWYGQSGYSDDYPIAVGIDMTKYQDEVYPTEQEILALREAK